FSRDRRRLQLALGVFDGGQHLGQLAGEAARGSGISANPVLYARRVVTAREGEAVAQALPGISLDLRGYHLRRIAGGGRLRLRRFGSGRVVVNTRGFGLCRSRGSL